jgi:hypothetical protein
MPLSKKKAYQFVIMPERGEGDSVAERALIGEIRP